jgi:GH24 family phage-related lysozyme (muramidase)
LKPLTVTKNEDGTDNEFHSVEIITQDIISYWKARLKQVRHPVLATRYAGLIYDFLSELPAQKRIIRLQKSI